MGVNKQWTACETAPKAWVGKLTPTQNLLLNYLVFWPKMVGQKGPYVSTTYKELSGLLGIAPHRVGGSLVTASMGRFCSVLVKDKEVRIWLKQFRDLRQDGLSESVVEPLEASSEPLKRATPGDDSGISCRTTTTTTTTNKRGPVVPEKYKADIDLIFNAWGKICTPRHVTPKKLTQKIEQAILKQLRAGLTVATAENWFKGIEKGTKEMSGRWNIEQVMKFPTARQYHWGNFEIDGRAVTARQVEGDDPIQYFPEDYEHWRAMPPLPKNALKQTVINFYACQEALLARMKQG